MRTLKDSGVEWIGSMPMDWGLNQAGQYLTQIKNKNVGMIETNLLSLSYGRVKRRDIEARGGLLPESFEGYTIVEDGDIVLRFTDLQNDQRSLRTGLVTERGIITSAYTTVRPNNTNMARYLHYALHAFDIRKGFYGMGSGVRQGLRWQEAKYTLLPIPDEDEQQRIADYLDKEYEEIDTAISEAQQSIAEYKNYMQVSIYNAVVKGLDIDARMVKTNVSWLGEYPEHWDLLPHKRMMRKTKRICEHWAGEPVLSLTTGGVIVRDIASGKGKFPATFDGYQFIDAGSLVLCLFDIDVTPRCVGLALQDGIISPAYSQFKMLEGAYAPYYDYYLRAMDDRKIYVHLTSTLRHSFTEDTFGVIPALRPPLEEQRRIADHLDVLCAEMNNLIQRKQAIIDDLVAYKQSLTFEIVTGKREV